MSEMTAPVAIPVAIAAPGHSPLASVAVFPHFFSLAADGPPSRSAASYAARRVIQYPSITTVMSPSQQKPMTGNPSGRKSSMPLFAPPTDTPYVSPSTSEATNPVPIAVTNASTSAPSVAQKVTTPSPGYVVPSPSPISPFFSLTSHSPLPYRDFLTTIIHRSPLLNSIDSHNQIYNSIIHPYDPDAFESLLLIHSLTQSYPLLVENLHNGFPLGEMPTLTQTVIIENHLSALQYPDTINQYLADEVHAGRMSGPFSRDATEVILHGPFFSSPLIVSVQIQAPGTPDKLRVCRHLSKSNKTTPSVNSYINKEDFPTRFDTASRVADIVSISLHHDISETSPSFSLLLLRDSLPPHIMGPSP